METIYITIIIILWALLGIVSLVPYLTPDEVGAFGPAKRMFTLVLFIAIGPIIGLSTVIHLLLFYYFGGDPNNLQQ